MPSTPGGGLLYWLGQDVAQGDVEILAAVLSAAVLEHWEDRLHRFFEDGAPILHSAAEGLEFGDRGALAHAKLAASIAEQVEHGHTLGDAGRVVGGKLEDAVTEPDVLGALARSGEKRFRRRAVRIFLEEVVLHLPRVVVTAPICQRDLR
jgi:hypothetical protein